MLVLGMYIFYTSFLGGWPSILWVKSSKIWVIWVLGIDIYCNMTGWCNAHQNKVRLHQQTLKQRGSNRSQLTMFFFKQNIMFSSNNIRLPSSFFFKLVSFLEFVLNIKFLLWQDFESFLWTFPFPSSYWANYNDLSRGHLKWWFSKGIPLKSP